MFLVGGVGEGGGPRVGWLGAKVSEKRRFVVCAPMVFPTHGPQPDGRTDLRGFGCVCATASRGRLGSGLTRNACTSISPLTRLFDPPKVQTVCILAYGAASGFFVAT
jgi:hypothetical protein